MSDKLIPDFSERTPSTSDLLLLSDRLGEYSKITLANFLAWLAQNIHASTRIHGFSSASAYSQNAGNVNEGDYVFFVEDGSVKLKRKDGVNLTEIYAFPTTGYSVPSGGIPLTDLASAVQAAINSISGKYEKPSGGIPASDLASSLQSSLKKWIFYGTCSGSTSTRSVAISDFEGKSDTIIIIRFTSAITGSTTLNITYSGGGSTTAKYIYHRNAIIASGVIDDGDTAMLYYDGDRFRVVAIDKAGGGDAPTNIPLASLAQDVQNIINSVSGKYVKPGSGIPPADLHQSIQDALTKVANLPDVQRLTLSAQQVSGQTRTVCSMTAREIYAALQDSPNAMFALKDREGRDCLMIDPPQNDNTNDSCAAMFATFHHAGKVHIIYTVGYNGVTEAQNVAYDNEPLVVTFTTSNDVITSDTSETDILAAAAAGRVVMANTSNGKAYFTGDDGSGDTVFYGFTGSGTTRSIVRYIISGTSVSRSAVRIDGSSGGSSGGSSVTWADIKPSGGIPKTDLAQAVQDALNRGDSAYHLPMTGIAEEDLATEKVVIAADTENQGAFVSTKTFSQISYAASEGFAIKPVFAPDDYTEIQCYGMDIRAASAVFAFLDTRTPSSPQLYIMTVTDAAWPSVAVQQVPVGGGGGGVVPTPTAAQNGYIPVANNDGTVSWQSVTSWNGGGSY